MRTVYERTDGEMALFFGKMLENTLVLQQIPCYNAMREVCAVKDFPMFTTEYGVASLVLKEIPYKEVAFVRILDVQPGQLKDHLHECIGFCRAAGAERILAAGHEALTQYSLESIVYKMSLPWVGGEPEDCLWPVTPENVRQWRDIYNKGMRPIDNHATLTAFDEKNIVSSGGAYFVHDQGTLLGIGWMEDSQLLALVSVVPGMGERVARALFSTVDTERITLEVVSTNARAIRLYERMGFVKTAEVCRWYRIV